MIRHADFTTRDQYGEESITADELIEDQSGSVDTGLLDICGNRIKRRQVKGPLGFDIPKN